MRHLDEEQLARLVGEEPDEAEAAHLATCEECGTVLDELREQTKHLGALPDLAAPAGGWARLESRLGPERISIFPRPSARWTRGLSRIAAAVALFVAGGVTDGLIRGARGPVAAPETASPVVVTAPARTVEEATARLADAQSDYLTALTRYSELTGADEAIDPVNRLAALEGIVLTTRAALRESPADPVINGYHLSALGQRDAMLKQISSTDRSWY